MTGRERGPAMNGAGPVDETGPDSPRPGGEPTEHDYPHTTPVGITEIADLLGVQRNTVDQWIYRRRFPAPKWTVGGRPAWQLSDILEWATATGRSKRPDTPGGGI